MPRDIGHLIQLAGWLVFGAGLALLLYGKYFRTPIYGLIGIVVAMAGAGVLRWRPGRPADRN